MALNYPFTNYVDAVAGVISSGNDIYEVVNGDNVTDVVVDQGDPIPTLRKTIKYIQDLGSNQFLSLVRDTNVIAENFRVYLMDTTTAALSVTLPASAAEGSYVTVFDHMSNAGINNILVDTSDGSLIDGSATYSLNTDGASVIFYKTSTDWKFRVEISNLTLPQVQDKFQQTFDTVADMVASLELQVGRTVKTLGYTTSSDGLGHEYKIVAAGTGTADGALYIDLAGISGQAFRVAKNVGKFYNTVAEALVDKDAVLGEKFQCADYATGNGAGVLNFRWVAAGTGTVDGGSYLDHDTLPLQAEQIFGDTISVKQFGAVGAGNETAILQNINAYTKNITIPQGFSIECVNWEPQADTKILCTGGTIKRYDNTLFGVTGSSAAIIITNDGIHIAGGNHSTGASGSSTQSWTGSILLNGGNNFTINRAKLTNQWGGVFGHENQNGVLESVGVTVANCHLDGCSHNTYLADIDGLLFINNRSENALRDGLRTYRNVRNIVIDNNYLINNGDGTAGQSRDGADLFIAGNTFVFTNNHVYGNATKGLDIKRGATGQSETYQNDKFIIANNFIHDNGDSGIEMEQSQTPSAYMNNISIHTNHIYNNTLYGIRADFCKKIDIMNNHIYSNGSTGIRLENSEAWTVNGNTVYDNSTVGILILSTNTDDGICTDNILQGGGAQVTGINCSAGRCKDNESSGHTNDYVIAEGVKGHTVSVFVGNNTATNPIFVPSKSGQITGVKFSIDAAITTDLVVRKYTDPSTSVSIKSDLAQVMAARQIYSMSSMSNLSFSEGDLITSRFNNITGTFNSALCTIEYCN